MNLDPGTETHDIWDGADPNELQQQLASAREKCRQLEQRLKETETQLGRFSFVARDTRGFGIETSPSIYLKLDDKGIVVESQSFPERQPFLDIEGLKGKSIWDSLADRDRPSLAERLHRQKGAGAPLKEWQGNFKQNNGNEVAVKAIVRPTTRRHGGVELFIFPLILLESHAPIAFEESPESRGDRAQRDTVEAALWENQRFIHQLTESSPAILYVFDLTECRYLYANAQMRAILGFAPDEIQSLDSTALVQLIHWKDRPGWIRKLDRLQHANDGEAIELEYRMATKTGEWQWLHSREMVFVRDRDGIPQQAIGTATDIGDRKRVETELEGYRIHLQKLVRERTARLIHVNEQLKLEIEERRDTEAKLRESERRYRLLAENATDMISTQTPDGVYTYTSPACEALLGYPPEDLIGHAVYEFLHPDDVAGVRALQANLLAVNVPGRISYRLRHRKGNYVWVETTSRAIRDRHTRKIIEIQAVSRNIQARKQTEAFLQENQERLASIAANVPGVVFRFALDRDGRRTLPYVSAGLEELVGIPPNEMMADPAKIFECVHPHDRERAEKMLQFAARTRSRLKHELRVLMPDGRDKWVRVLSHVHTSEDTQAVIFDGLVLDVTLRKVAEQALEESEMTKRALIAAIPDALLQLQFDGTVLDYIPGADCQPWESPRAVIGKRIATLLPPSEARAYEAAIARALDSGSYQVFEYQVPRHGQLHTYEARIAIVNQNRDRLLSIVREITGRKQAEASLRRQAEIIDRIHDSVICTDLDGYITSWNAGAERIYGYCAEEIIGSHLSCLSPQQHGREFVEQILRPLLERDNYEVEVLRRMRSGEMIWVQLSLSLMRDGADNAIAIVDYSLNITDRVLAQAALRESEARFRALFDNLSVGILLVNLSGQAIVPNEAFCSFLGYDSSETIGMHFEQVTYPDDLDTDRDLFAELIAGRRSYYTLDKRYIRKTGEVVWGRIGVSLIRDSNGVPQSVSVVCEDITERKQAEQERDRFFNLSLDLLAIAGKDGYFKRVNPAVSSILGYSEAEFLSTPFIEFVHPDDRAHTLGEMENNFKAGIPTLYLENRYRTKEGGYKWLVWNAVPVKETGLTYCVARDMTESKRALEELNRRELQYRTLAENTPDIIARFDRDMRHIYINPAIEIATGFSPDHFIGKSNRELGMSDEQIRHWEAVRNLVFETGKAQIDEFQFDSPDGIRYYQAILVPEYGDSDAESSQGRSIQTILSIARDITELKQAQESVQMAQARLQHLLTTSPAAIYSCKPQGNYPRTFVSNNVTAMVGYDSSEFLGEPTFWRDRIHPDDRDAVMAQIGSLADLRTQTLEYRFLDKQGRYRWIYDCLQVVSDEAGNPLEIVGSWVEISDRKQAEEALKYRIRLEQLIGDISTRFLNLPTEELDRGLQQGLQALGEFIGVERAYLFFLDENGEAIDKSHEWCAEQGCCSLGSLDGLPPPQLQFVRETVERERTGATAGETLRQRLAEANGRSAGVLPIVPLRIGGEIVGFLGCDPQPIAPKGQFANRPYSADEIDIMRLVGEILVTAIERCRFEQEEKRLIASLQERAAELARSNAELEQFAYVASHDLQEPLRMVSSYTQLFARRYSGELDEKAQKYIHYIVDGSNRMQQLIEDLLQYSRVGRRGEPFALVEGREIIDRALQNLQMAIKQSGAAIDYGELPQIKADRTQTIQLFQNLLGNAIKYRGERSPQIRIDLEDRGDCWQFCITDNGIGIEPKYAERIFLIFQRLHTREEYSGTGIGLAICKRIVERHGGSIWVESELGRGARFYFTLSKNPG
ncbi:PAS domain S-box protein [Oxynema sp. CENA135]|uniref:PAS domain S-box protein n=1 Tax=Oxynema sp. CENA135 TaxID=984206 RepID=UPI00190E2E02|nr:PAS domain S-box protein [Oxynema sp. CENA135]MBK4729975.1 PAS domain S-box protein [Oxynema sp. CENA135]